MKKDVGIIKKNQSKIKNKISKTKCTLERTNTGPNEPVGQMSYLGDMVAENNHRIIHTYIHSYIHTYK